MARNRSSFHLLFTISVAFAPSTVSAITLKLMEPFVAKSSFGDSKKIESKREGYFSTFIGDLTNYVLKTYSNEGQPRALDDPVEGCVVVAEPTCRV